MPELIIVSLYPAYLDCAHISKHPPGGKGLIYDKIGALKICVLDILTLHTYWQIISTQLTKRLVQFIY